MLKKTIPIDKASIFEKTPKGQQKLTPGTLSKSITTIKSW